MTEIQDRKREFERFAHETLKTFSLTPNYNKWVCDSFEEYVSGRTVLEVGCGIGNLTGRLAEVSRRLIGIDTSDFFIRHLKVDFPGLEIHNYDVSGPEVLALAAEKIEAVVAVNVLEHVKDDAGALRNVRDLLAPGGRLVLYVPALSLLYGSMDEALAHFRRYDRAVLERRLAEAGFEVEKIYYSNALGVLGWFFNGRVLRRREFPVVQTIVFDKLVPALAFLERIFRPPFGMNLTAIAVKKPGGAS